MVDMTLSSGIVTILCGTGPKCCLRNAELTADLYNLLIVQHHFKLFIQTCSKSLNQPESFKMWLFKVYTLKLERFQGEGMPAYAIHSYNWEIELSPIS